jgi:ssDNA-binding Zn-finger/Zn-ribbon topoisomerase 1
MSEAKVICPECGADMVLRRTSKFRWKNGEGRLFYGCSRWPECRAIHGAHPNGSPLGVPGNQETKAARIAAHAAFDELCKQRGWVGSGRQRRGAYMWLGRKLGIAEDQIEEQCHMAMFDIATCGRVIEICKSALGRERLAG